MPISPFLIGWAAGIIDGEGHVTIAKKNRSIHYSPRVTIKMTHKETLEKFKSIFHVGTIDIHFSSSRPIKWKDCWSYDANGLDAIIIIKHVFPYLITKKEQAKILLLFSSVGGLSNQLWKSDEVSAKRKELYEKIMSLNKRGK